MLEDYLSSNKHSKFKGQTKLQILSQKELKVLRGNYS